MKPRAYIFVGPTLAQSNYVPPEGVAFLSPAAQGDVYRAARKGPKAIGIIDGYFEGQASVWHKEILWAMDQGIHVFGSASMGALRAAELHQFGMQGVGRIFEAYRDGVLEDDDDVAVLHAPADVGFLALSEPMVNIRAALDEARKQRVIDDATSDRLERLAKKIFYQERSWSDLLFDAKEAGIADSTLADLEAWLPDHRVDQKETDARLMIDIISDCLDRNTDPSPKSFHFEWTEMWDEVVRKADDVPDRQTEDIDLDVLDEVRLDAGAADPLHRLALLRRLIGDERPTAPTRRQTIQAISEFREHRGLFGRSDLDAWLQEHHLDAEAFELMMTAEVAIEECLADRHADTDRHLLDQLRLSGRYQQLAARAAAKRSYLDSIGQIDPDHTVMALSPPQLRAWYFEQQRQEPIPEDLDRYARMIGFGDIRSFDQALRREYLYVVGKER